jgi:hypothetical protein
MKSKLTLFLASFLVFSAAFIGAKKTLKPDLPPILIDPPAIEQPQIPEPSKFPNRPTVNNPIPAWKSYADTVKQLEEWKTQSPGLVETGTYGKSSKGVNLSYIRVTNLYDPSPKKKVLITASIHGNEPLAASTTMAFIGTMLVNYQVDPEVTSLINSRDIYFVPVVSPDSYPNSREVDGVDPNRNFPKGTDIKKSVPPVEALKDFFLKQHFNAVISGHTFGRVYLIPYGDTTNNCPNYNDFVSLTKTMGATSNYKTIRCCDNYGHPIFGTEVDWYYRNGAIAIVAEYGTHQRIPSVQDIKTEFDLSYRATLKFIKFAPEISIK